MPDDRYYMRRCLQLAELGAGRVSPNPKVGAVVVSNGKIIGEGYHQYFGGPHAEVNALQGLTPDKLRKATLYVNMEPCCFVGKTPPCVELILQKSVERVVVGMIDPNPKVNGSGIDLLRKGGVAVKVGVLYKQCRELNRGYIKHITSALPEVILKTANTLDGRIATSSGESRWITSKEARIFSHSLRAKYDAIMVGIGTIIVDNPMLNIRHIEGENPVRVILDSKLRTPLKSNVVKNQDTIPTIIFTARSVSQDKIASYINLGCKVVQTPKEQDNRLSLRHILRHLAGLGITSVLVEGGTTVFTSFLQQNLVDRLIIMVAPKVIGGDGIPVFGNLGISRMSQMKSWKFHRIKRIGEDVMLDIILTEL